MEINADSGMKGLHNAGMDKTETGCGAPTHMTRFFTRAHSNTGRENKVIVNSNNKAKGGRQCGCHSGSH